jgi:hypothetical protein
MVENLSGQAEEKIGQAGKTLVEEAEEIIRISPHIGQDQASNGRKTGNRVSAPRCVLCLNEDLAANLNDRVRRQVEVVCDMR